MAFETVSSNNRVNDFKVRCKSKHADDHDRGSRFHLFTGRPRDTPHFELKLVNIIFSGLGPRLYSF